jgi:hypothetical protein
MSLLKCDITGSTDRVDAVHPQLKRDGLDRVCFRVGIALEQLRAECIAKFEDYKGIDKAEKIEAEIDKALKAFLSKDKKPEVQKHEIKQDAPEVKEDEMAKKKKKPYKKKK